jgi:FkbM family methyltransferase
MGRAMGVRVEPDFPKHFAVRQEITKQDKVLEVGANIGRNTRTLARCAGRVYSFEPSPSSYRCLLANTKDLVNVECYNCAVSDTTGTAVFNHQEMSGSLAKNDAIAFSRPLKVKTVSVEDIRLSFNIMVVDAECSEVQIFKSFSRWDSVDKVFCETHSEGGRPTKPIVKEILQAHYSEVIDDLDPGGAEWLVAKRTG